MEWDELYGAVVCAQAPMNVMIFPFWWMTLLPLPEWFLIKFNMFLCYLLYFPISIFLTILFTIIDLSYVFPAYFVHTMSLIQTITDSDETMDELSEKLERVKTILLFIATGPFILIACLIIDIV